MKRKDKEIVRQPDIVIRTTENFLESYRLHSKQYLLTFAAVLLIVAAGFVLTYHTKNQNDKVQYLLSQGMQAFEQYGTNGKKEDLDKAQTVFTEAAGKKRGESQYIAKLYLARIATAQGKGDDAQKLYQEVAKGTSSQILKDISTKAQEQTGKK